MSESVKAIIQIINQIEEENPLTHINQHEFDEIMIKFGAFLYLLNNKNISPTFLFLSVIKDKNLEIVFKKISGITETNEILKLILHRYPNLIKSKMVKNSATRIIKNKKLKSQRLKKPKA